MLKTLSLVVGGLREVDIQDTLLLYGALDIIKQYLGMLLLLMVFSFLVCTAVVASLAVVE